MALTPETRVSQSRVRTITQFPAEEARVSQGRVRSVSEAAPDTRVSQARVRAVVRGRVFDPRVRAWTYTLDGHDFYVLRLGNEETLVFDNSTREWAAWGSNDSRLWKAYTGTNWIGGRRLGSMYGSDVVVGDDANGAIYFLAPEAITDDDPLEGVTIPRPFRREMVAQHVINSGYDFMPCFGVQVFGSVGKDAGDVTLAISDDRGSTYEDAGIVSVAADDLDLRLEWPSLGSMRAPGRLFKLTDYGALQRVDHMQMEVGG